MGLGFRVWTSTDTATSRGRLVGVVLESKFAVS